MPHPLRRALAPAFVSFAVLACALVRAAAAAVPVPGAAPRAPEKIVAEFCFNCHGATLTGIPAPNLLDWFWIHGGRDDNITASIRDGYPESGMPAFRGVLSEDEIQGMLRYLRQQGREFELGRITIPAPPAEMTFRSERHAFRVETFVPELDTPWGIAFLPDGKILVTERPGRLRVVVDGKLDPTPIAGLPAIYVRQDGGLLDVIAHPDYAKNGWVYLAYTETGTVADSSMTVVIRGRLRAGRWVDQETIFRADQKHYTPRDTSHYGCRFLFDGAGHLFFTIGDRGRADDAQDLASPLGKIHRVFDDGRIPPDNPFVGRPGALGSIWSYGHRHPQGLQFHPVTGRLWESEHGPMGGDEINVIDPGHNYGWPVVSSGTDSVRQFEAAHPGMDAPLATWTPALAPSAIEFYAADRFPGWKNSLFVACLGGQQLRRIETDGDRVTHQEPLFKELGRVRDVVTGPDGLLYVAFNAPSRLARLVPVDGAAAAALTAPVPPAAVTRTPFGRTPEGVDVELFTLTNRHGLTAKVITSGAILADLRVPDREGKLAGVVREVTASDAGFQRGFPQAAAVFGRVANRIANARFTLDGREYQLAANNKPNHIHGGVKNFSRVVWQGAPATEPGVAAVTLTYVSPDGEEGFPGTLTTTLRYTLTDQDTLRLDYAATTDRPTPVNLTNHAYFNLAGGGDVLDYTVTLNADRYTVVDAALIPSGEIRPVAGSPLDFTTPRPLGARAAQLSATRRYDHNFVINRPAAGDASLAFAARVFDPRSGRVMETWTTQPGVQLYTSPLGDRPVNDQRGFFCLETQHYPDSINHPEFPSTVLRPGETFRATTEFRFSAK